MKAIVCTEYGPPDVLKLAEVQKPAPTDDQVLVRVRAASINQVDRLFRGESYLVRAMTGLRRPKDSRVGRDLSGQVEAVGRNATRFQPGDEVFGTGLGAFAEYACADQKHLALKPADVTFEQAAAVPVAAITALQGLRDKGRIQPGQKVLINGATGGVGTFAVQIAKSFGADVTGVCSTRNMDLVRSIGADTVIDYTREDFTQSGQRYDLVFDGVGNRSLSDCTRVMSRRGTYVVAGAKSLAQWFKAPLLSPFVSQKVVMFVAAINTADLVVLMELIQAKKVTPVVDKSYPLSQLPEAIRYMEEGHPRGKIILTIAQNKI